MYGLRDKVVTVRVDSDLYKKFKQTVEERERDCWKKTNASDLIEEAIKNYLSRENQRK